MATRQTTHILKNSDIVNRPLPSSGLLKGEPIINTADGIMYFSGVTTSTSEWTPAGTGTTQLTFFEVGSNLYDLRLRNRITKYEGQSGASLVGKFLSGTSSGFVLADISSISGVDTYVTGFTYSANTFTIKQNQGQPDLTATFNTVTGLTINGNLSATTIGASANCVSDIYVSNIHSCSPLYINKFNEGNVFVGSANTLTVDVVNNRIGIKQTNPQYTLDVGGPIHTFGVGNTGRIIVEDTQVGGAYIILDPQWGTGIPALKTDGNFPIAIVTNNTERIRITNTGNVGIGVDNPSERLEVTGKTKTTSIQVTSGATNGYVLTSDASGNGTWEIPTTITGGTISYIGADGTLTLNDNDGNSATITGFTDVFTTGATLIGNTAYFDTNDALSAYTLDLSSLNVNDTFVTGFTYNPSTNTFTISQNEGQPPLDATINTVTGLTVSNLTQGRVVYVGTSGLLTDEAAFTYNDGTDTLGVVNIEASGDVTIQGNLTVFGTSVSAFTSQLYVEDPNVIFNYNPTGNTTVTSVNAGLTIQEGNGITSGDVNLDIVRMQNLTGLTANQVPSVTEYTSLTGYANRGWITQLNDIVIRSTDITDGGSAGDINGVRVLAEFDVLDGGTY